MSNADLALHQPLECIKRLLDLLDLAQPDSAEAKQLTARIRQEVDKLSKP